MAWFTLEHSMGSKSKTNRKLSGHATSGTGRKKSKTVTAKKVIVAQPKPIYWPDHVDEVQAIAMAGATDEEMASILKVSPELLDSWMEYYPRFREAVEKGRTAADGKVVAALFKNATGYDYTEDEVVRTRRGSVVLEARKHVPGETNAQKFWLTNRQPEKWKSTSQVAHTSPTGKPVLVKAETKQEVIHSILSMISPQPDIEGE